MNRKNDPEQTDRGPNARTRRRLLRALGRSGGAAALGAVLAAKWRQPVVESVMLPAHAQTSVADSPGDEASDSGPAGCTIVVSVEFEPDSGEAYTLQALVGDDGATPIATLGEVTAAGVSAAVSGSATFAPGGYEAGWAAQHDDTQGGTVSFSVSCCDATYETSFSVSPSSAHGLGASSVPTNIDDGECEIIIA